MDKIERILKEHLESGRGLGKRESAGYPSAAELYRYLNDQMQDPELQRMLDHLRDNEDAQVLVSRARELLSEESGEKDKKAPPSMVEKAKALMSTAKTALCPHCGKSVTPFRRPPASQKRSNLALAAVALISLALSFIFHRYFMQFLIVTALAGMKAIVDLRATKTQIMIYKALSDDNAHGHSRLHEAKNRDGGI